MSWVRQVVGALVVLAVGLALGACGSAASPGGSVGNGGVGNGGVGNGGQSVAPAGPRQPPATVAASEPASMVPPEVTPVAGQRERRPVWRLVETGSGPSVVVELQAGGAPCDVVTGVVVDESATAVRLTVWTGREKGATCTSFPAVLGTLRVRVALTATLGSRPLRPGA
ncbi:MAG: hypothetical protein JWP82_186 [Humibacillus sp.]|nr:hypothetical protein [Humibacillus sp.]